MLGIFVLFRFVFGYKGSEERLFPLEQWVETRHLSLMTYPEGPSGESSS